MSVSQTDYSRLRHAPLVAIGAYNNPWSMRVTAELRFLFNHRTFDGITYNCIDDRRNPKCRGMAGKTADGRIHDGRLRHCDAGVRSSHGESVISAAGIETYGTLAASEFVTQAEYLGTALNGAPKDWRHKNVQFVLGTKIIDGAPGPPRVLASHYW